MRIYLDFFIKAAIVFFLVVVSLMVIQMVGIYYPLHITTTEKTSELAVVGEGKVEVVPDTATVQVGITVNNAPTTEAAQTEINTVNNQIVQAMQTLGIVPKDIKTSNYSIYPNYGFEPDQISGYNGNTQVSIMVRDTELVTQVVQEATAAGANEIHGTQFQVEDPSKYREEARQNAIENARQQGQKLAKELGISLGKVVNIVESSPSTVAPYSMAEARSVGFGGGGPAPDLQEGTQTITSTVTLYFEKR